MASRFYKYAQNDRPISIYLEMFLSLFFFNSVQTDCAYSVAFEKKKYFFKPNRGSARRECLHV